MQAVLSDALMRSEQHRENYLRFLSHIELCPCFLLISRGISYALYPMQMENELVFTNLSPSLDFMLALHKKRNFDQKRNSSQIKIVQLQTEKPTGGCPAPAQGARGRVGEEQGRGRGAGRHLLDKDYD